MRLEFNLAKILMDLIPGKKLKDLLTDSSSEFIDDLYIDRMIRDFSTDKSKVGVAAGYLNLKFETTVGIGFAVTTNPDTKNIMINADSKASLKASILVSLKGRLAAYMRVWEFVGGLDGSLEVATKGNLELIIENKQRVRWVAYHDGVWVKAKLKTSLNKDRRTRKAKADANIVNKKWEICPPLSRDKSTIGGVLFE